MALAFGSTARLAQDGDNLNDSVLPPGVDELILERTIGFEGDVPNGFVVHPDEALLYPLGSTLMVRSLASPGVQHFLQGSISKITAVAVSASGRYVATGHAAETAAFKADICVWDWEARERVCKFVLHKGQVQDLAFSAEERFLVSLGGEDDNTLVVWDVEEGKAVCGAPASKASEGYAKTVTFLNGDPMTFISGGDQTLRLWTLDLNIRKILAEDCVLGTLKRVITCIAVDAGDEGAYCGTTTGDVLYVALATRLFRFSGPQKRRDMFSRGVTSICLAGGDVVVGAGDGTLGMLDASNLLPLKLLDLQGSVTSIARDSPRGDYLYVGTLTSNIYYVETSSFEAELRSTCHPGKVNDVCFPPGYSEVIATCGPNDIRLWNVARSDELLRIAVPNLECLCVVFSHDGGALLSGWDDGKVRAFGPESGKLLFQIDNAHKGGVTALAVTKNGEKLVSGGQDGSVRVWRLGPESQSLEITMKEHRGAVSSLHMSADDLECVSSSADGSCILWDLEQWVRVQVMFAPSYFRAVKLHPEEGQAVSCGDDRVLAFWDVYDGTAIRELEQSHPVNSVDVFADGERFVSGGASKIVTLWDYDDGEVTHVGKGHGGNIIKVVVAPDQREIVSISDEGAIFFWRVPDEEEPLDV